MQSGSSVGMYYYLTTLHVLFFGMFGADLSAQLVLAYKQKFQRCSSSVYQECVVGWEAFLNARIESFGV